MHRTSTADQRGTARLLSIYDAPRWAPFIASSHPGKAWVTGILPISALLLWRLRHDLLADGRDADPRFIAVDCLLVALGVLQWFVFEYVVHRYVYHAKFNNIVLRAISESFHQYHHANPSDPNVMNAGPLLVWSMVAVVGSIDFVLCGFSSTMTALVLLSSLVTYGVYEWVHFFIHYAPASSGYLAWIQRHHLHHHASGTSARFPNGVNFGNTVSLFDHVLRTYDQRCKDLQPSQYPAEWFHQGKQLHVWATPQPRRQRETPRESSR